MQGSIIGIRRAAFVRLVRAVSLGGSCGALLTASCSSDTRRSNVTVVSSGGSAIFGGSAGQGTPPLASAGADAQGGQGGSGSAGAADAGSPDRCANVPASAEPRIDNFEDADEVPLSEPGRHGMWAIPSESDAGTLSFVIVEGGANGSDFAAHFTASGFSANGVTLGVSLGTVLGGVPCPYNAGRYLGIGLFVKGSGRVQLKVSTSDIFSTEFGGTCNDSKEQCWDAYQKALPLAADWTYHEVRWDELAQQGWGKQVALDPAHFMNLMFEATPAELPADFWVDELRFITADDGSAGGAGAGGAGQAGAPGVSGGGGDGG
jgi:hypothetical protein